MANNTLNYEFNLEVNRASIEKLKQYFLEVEKVLGNTLKNGPDKEIEKSLESARNFVKILNSAYNPKLGQFDMSQVRNEIQKSYGSMNNFKKSIESTSSVGARAYNEFAKTVLNTNLQLKQSSKLLDTMADTMAKTIRWGVASRVMNNMAGSIQKAWDFSVKLDKSLNDIRIVTDKSASDMERFAETANRAAKGLGASTRDYTEAALIFYQQGLNDAQAKKRAEVTLKAANVTGQSTQDVSEQLTAIWNGYKVSNAEAELYIDKVAAVAADTAADLEELATGMSKVASAANIMGVDIDQLNAQLATVVSVTRQAPESVGVAFKTIYARMGDIKAGLDDETTLGNYTSKMAELGVNVLDVNGNLRDMGEVIEEIGNNWENLSREQQINLSQTMAGVRQYNNLLALFDNWDMYTDALNTSADAAGTLQHQQDIYMESVEAHLQKMKTEAEETYKTLFDTNTVNTFIDAITGLNSLLNTFLKGLGGGMNDFLFIGSMITQLLNKQIGSGINNMINNLETIRNNKDTISLLKDVTESGFSTAFGQQNAYVTEATTNQFKRNEELLKLQTSMNEEEYNELNNLNIEIAYWEDIVNLKEEALKTGKSETKELEQQIQKLEKQVDITKNRIDRVDSGKLSKQEVQTWAHQKGFSKAQREKLNQILQESKENESFSSEQEQEIRKMLEMSRIGTEETLKNKWDIYNKKSEWEEKDIKETENKKNSLTKDFDDKVKNKERAKNIGDTINGLSSLIQVGTELSGIMQTLGDDEASIEEKAGRIIAVLPALIYSVWQLNAAIAANPYLLAAAAIGALAVGIGVLGFRAIEAADKQKVLNKQLKENQQAVDDARSAYEELGETINNYNTARDAIDELTEGTMEFYDAIVKSNEEAQKLIDKYNLIAGQDYTIDKNGLITLNQDTLNTKQFEAGQEVSRRSANQNETQLAIQRLETERIVKEFAKATNRTAADQQIGAAINNDQARKILESFYTGQDDKQSIALGELTQMVGTMIPPLESMKNATVNLDEEVGKNFAAYVASREREYQLQLQESANLIRGYGSQEQVERYNKMSSQQQESINRYVTQQRNQNQKDLFAKDMDFWDRFGINLAGTMVPGLGTLTSTGIIATSDINVNKAREEYAKNALGYTKKGGFGPFGGQWFDSEGRQVNQEDIKAIDINTAIKAYKSGEYSTKNALEQALLWDTDARNAAKNANLNESSQNYIAEAYSAIMSGNKKYDFSTLTNQERDVLSSMRYAQGPSKDGSAGVDTFTGAGFSSGELEKILAQTEEVGQSIQRIRRDTEYYNGELEAQAKQLGTSKEALDLYAVALDNANGQVHTQTLESAKNAAERYKFNKAYNESVKVYYSNEEAIEEYRKVIESSKEPSYDLADAVGELAISLKEMGLNLSGKSIAGNLNLIKQLMTGTAEEAQNAYEQLYRISQEDVLKKAFGDPKDGNLSIQMAEQLANRYTGIVDAINATTPGKNMSQTWADELIKMINDTQMAGDQIQQLAKDLKIQIPVEIQQRKGEFKLKNVKFSTNAQTVWHRYDGTMVNPSYDPGKKKGKNNKKYFEVHYAWKETTEAKNDEFIVPEGTKLNVSQNAQNIGGQNFTQSLGNRGSGSGGGGSDNEPDTMDPLEKEKDRYHDVNVELKLIQNSLDKLDKQKSKLFGQKLLDNLNKQLDLLNQKIETTNKKVQIAQGEAQELRNKLGGKGVGFNADGTISNYAQAYQVQLNYVNSLINQYNSMSAEGQKGFKDTVDKAKKDFDQFVENINRYDTLITDMIPGLETDIQEAINKQIDIQIEEFDMAIELRLDLTEATKDWNNFKKKIIDDIKEDDILGNAQARLLDFSMYYDENGKGVIQSLSKQLNDTLAELAVIDSGQTSKVYGDDKNKALEDLKKYWEEAMKQMEAMYDLQNEINQSYLDMMDEAQEKFDKQIEAYETLTNIIDHDKNLVSLIYGDEAYGRMAAFYDKQHENYLGQLNFASQQVEFWKEVYENAEEGSEAQEKAHENLVAATENLNGLLETSIEHLQDKYLNSLNLIFQDLNKKVTNGLGLEYVEEEWTLINKNADQYLDKINQLYGIQSLESKYLDAINDNTSLTAQKKLKDIMDEELTALREKDKLTEYDLERANKRYEIALKEIALEEAQQNKTQLRLRRDSQGNYRYEYVNDAEEVKKLQDELDDLYNSLYNFDKEHYIDNLNEILDVWKEFQEKMKEAAQINDPEERAQRELLIQEKYGELINDLVDQNQTIKINLYDSAFEDLSRLYDEDKQKFLDMTKEEQDAIMEGLVPQLASGAKTLTEVFVEKDGFLPTCEDSLARINDETQKYTDGLKEIEAAGQVSFTEIGNGLDKALEYTKQFVKENEELFKTYENGLSSVQAVIDKLKELTTQYDNAKKAADDATTAAYNYWAEQQRQAEDAARKEQERKAKEEAAKAAAAQPTPTPAAGVSGGAGGDGVPRVGDIVNYISGRYTADSYGGGASGAAELGGQVKITIVKEDGRVRPIHIARLSGGALGWVSRGQISGYDTGGYTGEWGNSGRLALLHQKELVLNKEDTRNLLSAVNVMRNISTAIGSRVLDRLAMASANNNFSNGAGGILDQNVHIEANFPNVKNSTEIEDALNNLVNRASQFVQNKER